MEQYTERQSEAIEPKDAVEHAGPGRRATERGNFVIPRPGEKVYFPDGDATPLAALFAEQADRIENVNTRRDAAKFVSAFGLFDAGRELMPDALDQDMVRDFRSFLADRGHTASYIAKRMQNFRSIYRRMEKEGRVKAAPAGCFDSVSSYHPCGNPQARICAGRGGIIAALGRLARMRINDPGIAASREALLQAILSAGRTAEGGTHRGGFSSDSQLLMRSCGINVESCGLSHPAELWIKAARECGVSATEIAAVCETIPEGFGEGSLSAVSDNIDRDAVLRRVESAILGNEPAWYALRIRKGSDSETVRRLIAADNRLTAVRPFAPTERLLVRRGKRMKPTLVDRIRRVMFLETAPALISAVAAAIAPAASIYRQSAAADAPFAKIPRREMDNFRILLDGAAAKEIELADSDELAALPAGTEVEVADGPFAGYRGRTRTRGGRHLLTVALTSDFGILVTATIPAPFLRKME